MHRRIRILVLPFALALLWTVAAPAHAAGEAFSFVQVNATGCTSGAYKLTALRANLDGGSYTVRTVVTVGGKIYTNEDASININGNSSWSLFDNFNYDDVPNKGTWPMPENQQMRVRATLERPKGTILDSWTLVTPGCNSATVLYNNSTARDLDEDLLPTPQDACPTLAASAANGCPQHGRALSIKAKKHPHRLVGRLAAPSASALAAKQSLQIWKVKRGPDKLIGTVITKANGAYKIRLPRGRYYVIAPEELVPTVGQAPDVQSRTVRIKR